MRRLAVLAALLLAAPALAQNAPAARLAHFNAQSSGTLPAATQLFSASVTTTLGQGAGYMMLFAGGVPSDGAVDPVACFYVPSGPLTTSLSMGNYPGSTTSGLSWAFSSGANCQTKVASTVNYVSIAYR